jgi:hypothetical protein
MSANMHMHTIYNLLVHKFILMDQLDYLAFCQGMFQQFRISYACKIWVKYEEGVMECELCHFSGSSHLISLGVIYEYSFLPQPKKYSVVFVNRFAIEIRWLTCCAFPAPNGTRARLLQSNRGTKKAHSIQEFLMTESTMLLMTYAIIVPVNNHEEAETYKHLIRFRAQWLSWHALHFIKRNHPNLSRSDVCII